MMTRKTKQELIAQIVAMLNAVIEVENEQQITEQKSSAPVEMLTVKECTEAVKGLSEHTVRQLKSVFVGLVSHNKIFVRIILMELNGLDAPIILLAHK